MKKYGLFFLIWGCLLFNQAFAQPILIFDMSKAQVGTEDSISSKFNDRSY